MAFGDSISKVGVWMMPALAILNHEWRGLWTSWLVRLWLIAAALLVLLTLPPNWAQMSTAPLLATMLFPFLVFPWFLPAILLGITPVTGSRLEALADGILSRPITRYEYFLACWAARVAVVLTVFATVMLPVTLLLVLAKRPAPPDSVTWYGTSGALIVVALVLSFLVSLGFLAGTLLRKPLVAALVLIFAWYPVNLVMHTFSLEELSPISLSQAIPTLLRTPWRAAETGTQRLDQRDLQAVADQAANFLNVLSGGSGTRPRESKETFFDKGDYRDFSLIRVLIGYGLPMLAALGLSTLWFSRRDL
jgi:ABC-type transport system involved in multi-copper enzyme maturation permease subunit